MGDNDDVDSRRSRPRKKDKPHKKVSQTAGLPFALLGGGLLACLVVLALVIAAVVWLFGGLSGTVIADARPAVPKPAPARVLPAKSAPSALADWKVTADGLARTSNLASAVVLPDGEVEQVHFGDPAQAVAAVVLARGALANPRVVVNQYPTFPLDWVQVDLKAGRVVGTVPVGTSQPGGARDGGFRVANAALSPSGDRLAVVVSANRGPLRTEQTTLLQVWDKGGKKLLEHNRQEFPAQPRDLPSHEMPGRQFLEFLGETQLLVLGPGGLVALDVPSGKVIYTLPGVKAPAALSPGRKWVCATAGEGLRFFNTSDGTAAGEIPAYGKPSAVAFRPDGAALAVSYGTYYATWDITGKSTGASPLPEYVRRARVARPTSALSWFGEDRLLFGNLLLDRGRTLDPDRDLWLCEYSPALLWVAWSGSPDGRLWAVGNYKEILGRWEQGKPVSVTPGPIADAGRQGKNLLAACTVPSPAATERLQAAVSGILFRAEDPARIEVVGSGSMGARQALANAAAEALAHRGKAVDPSAKVGVRIELSRAMREKVSRTKSVVFIGEPPPGELRDVHRIEARMFLVDFDNRRKSEKGTSLSLYIGVNEADWETVLCRGIGKRIGTESIPLEGSFTARGEGIGLPAETVLGIDGVVP